jgi:uncharacterized protein YdhG (YjbR/CyaY superfamily)
MIKIEFNNLLIKLSKLAQRAIQNAGIKTIEQISEKSEAEISDLHGIGKNAISIIRLTLGKMDYLLKTKNKKLGETKIMDESKNTYGSIDEYIILYPPETQEILKTLREVIKAAAPTAEEKISYQMPTFYLHGNLVHFAVCKKHIGFYPAPSGINAFKNELSEYKGSKGAIQFPINKPLPFELISKIVKFRVSENMELADAKLKRKKK